MKYSLNKIKKYFKSIKEKNLLFLVTAKKGIIGSFEKKYYSESGEDVVLSRIFSKQEHGFYVDVGAYHPKQYSNTYLLYKKGWKGINIDANPDSIKIFKWSRPSDINLNLGISNIRKEIPYYRYSNAGCNTFDEAQAKNLENKDWISLIDKSNVSCFPLSEVLEKNIQNSNQEIDLLSVDIEGLDLEAIESNDWEKFRPKVIVIEGHGFDPNNPDEYKIHTFLKSKGYSLYAFTGLSLIYKKYSSI